MLRIPQWPFKMLVFVGGLLLWLELLLDLFESVGASGGGRNDDPRRHRESWEACCSRSSCFLGMPIAFVLMLVGFLGIWLLSGPGAALPVVAQTVYGVAASYPYTIIPLFILMGSFAGQAGITRDLYTTFDKLFRKLPGGLGRGDHRGLQPGSAALSGSSVAAAAAMGNVALPEMRRFGYHPEAGDRHRRRRGDARAS